MDIHLQIIKRLYLIRILVFELNDSILNAPVLRIFQAEPH